MKKNKKKKKKKPLKMYLLGYMNLNGDDNK